jgi:hypothetical protein
MYREIARKDYLAFAKCRKKVQRKQENPLKNSLVMYAVIWDI